MNTEPSAQDLPNSVDETPSPNNNKKKAIVAILLGVLLIAVLTQPKEDLQSVDTPTLALRMAGGDLTSAAAKPMEAAAVFSQIRELPRVEFDAVASSQVFRPDVIERPRIRTEQLRVQAVYGSGSRQTALVGDTILHSGQPIRDGRKVLSVSTEGVQLEGK